MWFDGIRQPNTIYVASVSRGKDSTAMLRAIQLMGWPLDAIVSVDIWFDEETPAELPPMVAFKDRWDAKCLDVFGMPVTRLCATQKNGEKKTYCDVFYKEVTPKRERESVARRLSETWRQQDRGIPAPRAILVQWRTQTSRYLRFSNKKRAVVQWISQDRSD
ncbi:hypothetical protein [Treponema sp.]|uniref:hypothetical protein n=1 Tax=Treponema sp. TaxID=166 RepID=UPI00388D88BA